MENVNILIGKELTEITVKQNSEIYFTCSNGDKFLMFHDQDCCESVEIEEIIGDLTDLINTPIIMAEEITSTEEPARDEFADSYTWTFYKFATIRGYVTIRWYGESNGYYSESVDFMRIN